jgi:phosphohistidine phosphatase SixA
MSQPMFSMGVAVVVLCAASLSAPATLAQTAEPVPTPATLSADDLQALTPQLRKGGYIFYLRHGLTRLDQEDRQPVVKDDCATQRNLSDEGRKQAETLGAALRKARIPVGRVLSSPFCRCLDTARLAFASAEVSEDLYFAIGLTKLERQAKGASLRRLLAEQPTAGSNSVLVAHTANLEEAVGFWPKPEGTAILFQPDGTGGFRVLGRIPPDTWVMWAGR